MEGIAKKTSLNQPPDDSPMKPIKSLEKKNKLIFDTLNIQQNSLDNLLDKLAESVKDQRRTKDQLNQAQSKLSGRNDQQISELSTKVDALNESYDLQRNRYEDRFSEISSQIQVISQSLSDMKKVVSTIKGELEELQADNREKTVSKPVHQATLGNADHFQLLAEMKALRHENSIGLNELRSLILRLSIPYPEHPRNYTPGGIFDPKQANMNPMVGSHIGQNEIKTASTNNDKRNRKADDSNSAAAGIKDAKPTVPKKTIPNVKSLPIKQDVEQKRDLVIKEDKTSEDQKAAALVATGNAAAAATIIAPKAPPQQQCGKGPTTKVTNKQDMERGDLNGVKAGASVTNKPAADSEMKNRAPGSREELANSNNKPTKNATESSESAGDSNGDTNGRDSYRRKDLNRKSRRPNNSISNNSNQPDISIDDSYYNNTRYRTRKCLIIHDPYFDQFDKGKFTKWLDVSTIRYETLHAANSDNSLMGKVRKMNPEVIFLHLGQADLLNKTRGDTVIAETKELMIKLLEIAGIKLCLSQIIPLKAIAQVKSVIRQVNRELSSLVTDMRKSADHNRRLFTQNNDALAGFIYRETGGQGYVVGLNDRGRRKLWLHLKDGLHRSLNISQRNSSDNE